MVTICRRGNIIQLTVSPEYQKLVPALSDALFVSLKESIKQNGLWVPIIINKDGVILDGHHRYHACIHTETKINVIERNFENKLKEKKFVIECNVKRRQLTDWQKGILAKELLKIEEEEAKLRQKEAGSEYGRGQDNSLSKGVLNLSTPDNRAMAITAKKVGLKSGEQLRKILKIDDQASDDTKQKLSEGKSGYTINKAYQKIRKNEKKEKRLQEIKETQVNLPDTITLHNLDFRTAPIQDNSVSLIWTDPPYDEASLPLYEDLAIMAAKVLKEGGSLMCYAGHYAIDRIITMMKNHGLKYQWQMVIIHSGHKASQHGPRVFVGYKPILWFVKGKYEGNYINDTILSTPPDKSDHEWAQSTTESDYYIEHMTVENEIILDPFMGSGTTGVSAKRLGRQFIGCENNAKDENNYFEIAQRKIADA